MLTRQFTGTRATKGSDPHKATHSAVGKDAVDLRNRAVRETVTESGVRVTPRNAMASGRGRPHFGRIDPCDPSSSQGSVREVATVRCQIRYL